MMRIRMNNPQRSIIVGDFNTLLSETDRSGSKKN